MNVNNIRRLAAVCLCAACALLVSVPRADEPAATGDLWEVVSQMSMEGMSFALPAQKAKFCAAKEWTRPPGGDNDDRGCTSSDMMRDENVVTWTSACADGTTGTGRIVREGDDAYSGELHYTTDEGNIVIKLNGRRIGDCDNPQ